MQSTALSNLTASPPSLAAAVSELSTRQRRFIAALSLVHDNGLARRLTGVSTRTWYRWSTEPPFQRALQVVDMGGIAAGDAIAVLAAEHAFTVADHIFKMAVKPWEECGAAELRTKRWAMEIFLNILGSRQQSKPGVSFRDLIVNLESDARPPWMKDLVVDAETVEPEG